MDMHKCKLCFRKFMCGKALGGHMARSHFTKLPLPQKKLQEKNEEIINESTSTESSLKGEEKGVAYVLRENPRKSFKVVDPEFFDAGSVVILDKQNGTPTETETENESELKSTRRRSNRGKRMMQEDESINELSYIASNEDVALFLLMLSRGELKLGEKHKCEICNKVFKSSQALGGHRVSHKSLGIKKRLKRNVEVKHSGKKRTLDENKIHECPHCGRLFGSGQALGGHKRSHSLGSPTRITTTTITSGSCSSKVGESLVGFSSSEKFQDGLIDLNFPAPLDDDYDDGFSHQEASAVYEASVALGSTKTDAQTGHQRTVGRSSLQCEDPLLLQGKEKKSDHLHCMFDN
ncbi:hypothetical protein Leryth_014807 [Lithospermum erythrorhizon]|nr:hypothetical protein Leryth_014807 [Lithospermum erythrorhizon]